MKYQVALTDEAKADLISIYRFVASASAVERADGLLDGLEKACLDLERFPLRGHVPIELERIGILDVRELTLRPYRIVYRVAGRRVYVHGVFDGRRDFQTLLRDRLLR